MWNKPSELSSVSSTDNLAESLRLPLAAPIASSSDELPFVTLQRSLPSRSAVGNTEEVIVSLARAPIGSRVYLEFQPNGGPHERIPAFAVAPARNDKTRQFRAVLPAVGSAPEGVYIPVAVVRGKELRGRAFRRGETASGDAIAPDSSPLREPAEPRHESDPSATERAFPALDLIARVEAELPTATVFGATPEGVRIAFYIADGRWNGPRVHARYKSEGGDWLLVRSDGVGIPNVRATLETHDGSLLYYELTGTVDLGPDGHARILANTLPEVAAFSAVARVSTSSERWKWLNRLTLVGAGSVNLKLGRVCYDLYAMTPDPALLRG